MRKFHLEMTESQPSLLSLTTSCQALSYHGGPGHPSSPSRYPWVSSLHHGAAPAASREAVLFGGDNKRESLACQVFFLVYCFKAIIRHNRVDRRVILLANGLMQQMTAKQATKRAMI